MNRDNPWRKHGLKKHNVLVDNPHPQSYAMQVKLRAQLLREALKTGDEWNYFFWMKFRDKYLGAQRKLHGMLTCFYCNKTNLKIDTANEDMRATIDHFVPVSKGGPVFEESNLRVACYNCNQTKGSEMPKEILYVK